MQSRKGTYGNTKQIKNNFLAHTFYQIHCERDCERYQTPHEERKTLSFNLMA
jgi:hypothetical protein